MGLDITHCRATLQRPSNGTKIYYETADNFDDFNVPFDHFERYIQIIDVPEIVHTVILVNNANDMEDVRDWFKEYDYDIILNTQGDDLSKQLKNIEQKKTLNGLLTETDDLVVHSRWTLLHYYAHLKKTGFYYNDIGYQRKSMNGAFWEKFCSSDVFNYALKEDFDLAYKCVTESHIYGSEKMTSQWFKENFIDNFIDGASYLNVSY